MGKHYSSNSVCCPYYKQEDRLKIFCEGVSPGATTHMVFQTKERLKEWRAENCEKYSSSCPLCIGLNEKWGCGHGQ